jgi:hypothetical protein
VEIRCFRLPKGGSSLEDYEDAEAHDEAAGRCAIADGATEASFSKQWADLLVRHFVDPSVAVPTPATMPSWLEAPARQWREGIQGRTLPWYAQAKAEQGAFAALLGLQLRGTTEHGSGRWRAVAVGDCCLFHLRPGQSSLAVRRAFPMQSASEFGRAPYLIGTRPTRLVEVSRSTRSTGGWYHAGDIFVLASDALAHYLVRANELDTCAWNTLVQFHNADDFDAWASLLRSRKLLRNDDVTALVVTC